MNSIIKPVFPNAVLLLVMLSLQSVATAMASGYATHPKAEQFIERMVTEHQFDRDWLTGLLADAERKDSILEAIARPAEKTKTWGEYRDIFITQQRINQGRAFMQEQAAALQRAEKEFGVPVEIISAIIGVETRYGRNKGGYRVLDSLATLGFDYPPRGKFFSTQLEQYLLLVKEQKFDPRKVKGSYAGAMGYGQFIPSSYRHYAIDFDGDGIADIVENPVDAIGSVANYFKAHGWRPGEPVTSTGKVGANANRALADGKLKPKLTVAELQAQGFMPDRELDGDAVATAMLLEGNDGEECWIGLHNFYVITRYNHSQLYAMAVYQLSQALKAGH